MANIPKGDRDVALALVIEALRAAERTAPPPETEQGDWLRGNVKWSEPDEHGWVALIPVQFDVWVPKVLVAWQMALQSGDLLQPNWMNDPRFSLRRWSAIEAAVHRLYTAAEV